MAQSFLAFYVAVPSVTAQEQALPPLDAEVAAEFHAIGRLGYAGYRTKQSCTGTLIAPDLIMTAAHCVSGTGRSENVFIAGWSRGNYIASRKSKLEIRHPDYSEHDTQRVKNDVALVVLNGPIEDVAPIPLGEVKEDALTDTDVALIGYHRKTPHMLSGDFNCPVTFSGMELMHVGCPVTKGNSGGPILRSTEHGVWEVVGVVSSQNGDEAVAVKLPDWLRREVAAHLQTNQKHRSK